MAFDIRTPDWLLWNYRVTMRRKTHKRLMRINVRFDMQNALQIKAMMALIKIKSHHQRASPARPLETLAARLLQPCCCITAAKTTRPCACLLLAASARSACRCTT
jgi:phage tail sheath gpL-like